MLNETMIRCFLTLAGNLSFTKTAQEMYMTQQAVSKYIARLEETLGFRLFLRTRHYVKLTRAGEMYRDLFARYQEDFDRVGEAVAAYYRDLQKQIKLGYLEMLDISSCIADALKQARQKDGELRFSGVKLPQHELLEQFADRELDMIITYREFAPKEAGVRSHRILNTPLVLLVSPEDPVNGFQEPSLHQDRGRPGACRRDPRAGAATVPGTGIHPREDRGGAESGIRVYERGIGAGSLCIHHAQPREPSQQPDLLPHREGGGTAVLLA